MNSFGKAGTARKQTEPLKKCRNLKTMLRIMNFLTSIKGGKWARCKSSNRALIWFSTIPNGNTKLVAKSYIDSNPLKDKLFLKFSFKKLWIYTSGTGVEKLWIKNLSCIPWEALSLLLKQRSWTLQQNCTHTSILTGHALMSTSKKQEDKQACK